MLRPEEEAKVLLVGELVTCFDDVSGGARDVGHDGPLAAAEGVQEAALAHVGPAHQSHLALQTSVKWALPNLVDLTMAVVLHSFAPIP